MNNHKKALNPILLPIHSTRLFRSKTAALKYIRELKFPHGGHWMLTVWYSDDGTILYHKVEMHFRILD